jgi:hypothetical protein
MDRACAPAASAEGIALEWRRLGGAGGSVCAVAGRQARRPAVLPSTDVGSPAYPPARWPARPSARRPAHWPKCHDIGSRYRDIWSRYRYIPILIPISGYPVSGHTRYRDTRYRECPDIRIPDIGTCPDIRCLQYRTRYRVQYRNIPISGHHVPISGFGKVPDAVCFKYVLDLNGYKHNLKFMYWTIT